LVEDGLFGFGGGGEFLLLAGGEALGFGGEGIRR
jgi:hypothetical protein